MKSFFVAGYVFFATVLLLAGCNKAGAESKAAGKTGLQVDSVKVTDDIDSTFNVQAAMEGDSWGSGGGDLGIVGKIDGGKLTMSVPEPAEEQLWDPSDNDLGSDTEGLKISQLHITTSKAYLLLDNAQSGGSVYIYYANKDGSVDFYGNSISLKKGWNFVEGFQGNPIPNAKVWTSLQDVYEEGYYKWKPFDK